MGIEPLADEFSEIAEQVVEALADEGYCVVENVLPPELTASLYQQAGQLMAGGDFSRAGIGRNTALHLDESYRTDEIHWLEHQDPVESQFLNYMERLRRAVNRGLFMGLFDYEAHFAHYAPGAFYKRHLDAFRGNTNRVLTTVYYLNPEWSDDDGGEILLYRDEASEQPFLRITPKANTLVVFLSERFPHEVVAARRDRYSIAGWFRVNSVGRIDPPL